MKTILALSAVVLVGACTPGQVAMNMGSNDPLGGTTYAWVGCHVVTKNPANSGEWATSLLNGDLKVGDKFYMKQVSPDGTVGPVTTGKPCVDD